MPEAQQPPLDEVATKRLQRHLKILTSDKRLRGDEVNAGVSADVTPEGDNTSETQLVARREIAVVAISAALADPTIGPAVSELIVRTHQESEEHTPNEVYAYWGLLRKIDAEHPDAVIPKGFLAFLQEVAETADEPDLAFDAMMRSSFAEEVIEPAQDSPSITEFTVAEEDKPDQQRNEKAKPISIADYASSLRGNFSEASQQCVRSFYEAASTPAQKADATLLKGIASSPSSMRTAITYGKFQTKEGLIAAKAQHDAVFLKANANSPTSLRNALTYGQFQTKEGLIAAKAQHDAVLLKANANSPTSLRNAFSYGWFQTKQGKAEAQVRHDKVLLEANANSPTSLRNAFSYGWFQTTAGKTRAQIRHDEVLLRASASSKISLQTALNYGYFQTAEGRQKAQQRLQELDSRKQQ